ncbi:Hypothetical protein PHPALM_12901 [Phytophthora palmivora]|uniref:Integrase catalytic domain-containing protein n=1 Tax=Phytophthora palmivora TaxID=4796 RepID=A0A2P4XYJ5_9STRA|nr:Hypothetical protein PHPALM_12901 [Phytophthora palmivora]
MQEVAGRDRAIAYASKLLVGSEKNWINNQDGTSEIECWGIVWATRKSRCYLDRCEFDLYTDHKALLWVFSDANRTNNAKLARWAMELSQLRFKVYLAYASKLLVGSEKNWINNQDGTSEIECWGIVWATRKFRCYLDRCEFDLYTDHKALLWVFTTVQSVSPPGTSMGHVDGLSRLHAVTVNAVTMADLLNEANEEEPTSVLVGEGGTECAAEEVAETAPTAVEGSDQVLVGERLPDEEPTADPATQVPPTLETPLAEEQLLVSPIDVFGLDQARFKEEQKRTPWILAMIAFLESGALALDAQLRAKVLSLAPHYTVKNGILMRRVHLKARAGPARSLEVPVIPINYVATVLHHCHADVFAAHVGVTKTMDKVRKHAYWHGWKKDVAEYVRECTVCGSSKGYRPWRNGLMQKMPIQELSGPFSLLVVDAVGPLVTTPRGNKFILVFADYFTRWVEAFAVERLDSVTFVETMVNEVISRHGVPEKLLSDQGPNFISEFARSLYETLGIKKLFGAAYHPQTQGLVERFNGTLIGMLRMYVSESQDDWDLYLPRVLFAYRTSYHEALGDSPFFSLYGRDPVLPLDLAFLNTSPQWKSNEVATYRRRLYLSLRDTRRLVERQLLKAQSRHGQRLQNQVAVKFGEGDAVWVYQYFRARRGERTSKKLAFSWHGPYRIVGTVGENACRVAIPSHPNRVVTINVNRLKPFQGRWSRPYPTEIPEGVETTPGEDDDGPLAEEDLPSTSYVERLVIGSEDTAFTGASLPVVDVLARRKKDGELQYLVLLATYETSWLPATSLSPDFDVLITAFENTRRREQGLPQLRRSARLVDANAAVDEDELLF